MNRNPYTIPLNGAIAINYDVTLTQIHNTALPPMVLPRWVK
ncbi:hypothetical protein [Nostoc sp. PCC 7524]|nr:hypothetical protein [Nostoc sp. PCC 7524]